MLNDKSTEYSAEKEENSLLKIQLRQLKNELKLTQIEYDITTEKYLEMVDKLEKKVIEKNEQLYYSKEVIRQKNQELQLMLDTAPAFIFYKNAELKYIQANNKFLSFFNLSPSDIIQKTDVDLFEEKTLFNHEFDLNAISEKKPIFHKVEHVKFKQNSYYFSVDRIPLLDHEDKVTGLLCYAIDVTELNAIEQEKSLLLSQLRQAQKIESLGTLASGIAHDFNNILAAIIGYAEMAMNFENENENQKKYLSEVLNASSRAKDLIKQILTFSRKTETIFKPIDLSVIIDEVIKFLRPSLPSSIDLEFNHNIDHAVVLGDYTQVHQVIMNLCTNAYQSMKDRKGKLEISIVKTKIKEKTPNLNLLPGFYYKISIKDSGIGISKEHLEKIFEPYFTTKKSGEGTGLGLSVVIGIIKVHKGTIDVESEINKGSTFNVYLPKLEFSQIENENVSYQYEKGNEKILFVDDEKSITTLITEFLCYLGYTVISTTDSNEAWEFFQDNPQSYQLVITDMTMPKMSGIELIQKIRIINRDIPIILSTGYGDIIDQQITEQVNNIQFLQKPYELYHISSIISNILQNNIKK